MKMFAALVALFAAAPGPAVEAPCPEPKPAFDHAAIDRTLKEPRYGSLKPAYRFLALGPEGKTIVALVADESKGLGSGVDRIYVDLNANRDLTEPDECFVLDKPSPMREVKGQPLVTFHVTAWGGGLVKERKLDVPDPALDYSLAVVSSFLELTAAAKDGSWRVKLSCSDATVPWGTLKREAPVFRVGGREFSLRNEDFVVTLQGGRKASGNGVGATLRPGARIELDGAVPFFAGSSPSVVFAQGHCWVSGGVRGVRGWLETPGEADAPHITPVVFRDY
ncbi:MAG TPA: hypothetical protein PLE19_05745 [Planctomycetota bacterium]|nr:hypothetical protein [Planctomycetota bacterium]HRR81735.1 hypothetical protein [Planctomycetota bacterium]HRT95859.1 hypothetical protein [Planctomycetota bacterium]